VRNEGLKILLLAIVITALSILTIYSANYAKEGAFWQSLYQRQMISVGIGMLFFSIFARMNYRRIWDWTYVIYGVSVGLLLMVVIMGIIRLGAQRWLKFGWINLQPSELAKLAIVMFLAKYYSKKSVDDVALKAGKYGILKGFILPCLFVLIPVGLIVDQPDLGSGLIVFFIFLAMLYLGNVKLRYIVCVAAVLLIMVPVSWHFLRDYQKSRVLVFLNPNSDPLGAGYTVIQSKIAIGSGGFFGKGWLGGTQSQLYFLPESHTDFIFATFTEEWGFMGGLILLSLYFFIIRYAISIAEHTSDHYGKLLALGIAFMLSIQIFVNVAMNMGLAPVVGVPLPLMSYGGSSVFITYIALGILANINRTRAVF